METGSLRRVDWVNTIFLSVAHVLALVAILYMIFVQFSWWTLGLALLWKGFVGLSVTGGYHRLFAHRAYQCSPILRAFYLFFGAGAVQNSALKWSADHRVHHAQCDKERDPYNIKKGFWWAHIGWVFFREDNGKPQNVPDLEADLLVRLQHKFYLPLAIFVGAILPMALGSLWGDPWGALLVVGFLRLIIQYHETFTINSVAHKLGSRPYSLKTSARDSLVTALLSLGEGYHNFHHRFPCDYRNGIKAWHFDPTKWWVWGLARVGLAKNLRKTSREAIQRARDAVRVAQQNAQAPMV